MSARSVLLSVLALGAGVYACTGGPSDQTSALVLLGFPGGPASATYERPGTSLESPGAAREAPPSGADMPSGNSDAPSGRGGCPPCGTFICEMKVTVTSSGQTQTSSTSTSIPMIRQANGSCGVVQDEQAIFLGCDGVVRDASGKAVATWTAFGSSLTVSTPSGQSVCTLGGAPPTGPATRLDAGI